MRATRDLADFAPLKSLDFLDQARAARRSTPKRQRPSGIKRAD